MTVKLTVNLLSDNNVYRQLPEIILFSIYVTGNFLFYVSGFFFLVFFVVVFFFLKRMLIFLCEETSCKETYYLLVDCVSILQ
jgi:hypothetical protein